jgi:CheY-like chemotaxis protein/two-component sensor histidine kinase
MSHEMRTPLHGILGMLQLVRENELEPDVQRQLDMAQRSAEALSATIDEILDFSKIEARKIDLSMAWFDIRDVVADVTKAVDTTARAKNLAISCDVASDVPRRAWGDAARVRQVLMNLVGNAVKFTERGSVMINVAPRENALAFSVRDTGVGIDAATRSRIFEPFVQGDARRFSGTGLGLAIARRIVEAMGGKIEVESEPDFGSTFRFTIGTRFDAPAVVPMNLDDQVASSPRRHTVLVVDDNFVNQEFAAEAVRRLGHDVAVASSGEEALDLTAFRLFDLVLMDVQMPGIDGLEATRRLRAAGSLMRIVALTAHSTAEDRQRCLEAGMDDVLVKPVNTARLAAVLHGPIPEAIVNNTVLFARVREAFHTQTPALLAQMHEAIATGDSGALARSAHTLKGALSNFDAAGAIDAAMTLERKAKENQLGGAKEVFARLVMAVRSLEKSL